MAIRKPSESDIVRSCLQLLALKRIWAWRNNSGALASGKRVVRFGAVGSADIIGALPAHGDYPPGRMIAVECKTAKGRLSPSQELWQQTAREQGVLALVVRSVHELMSLLGEVGL